MEQSIISVVLLGFVCGAVARMLVPNDAFEHMSGPVSWVLSLVVGMIGALLGYWIFTSLLGIGDTDKFDWGGILGALIGSVIVVGIATLILNRTRGRRTV
jgi:uncharacterized membrane protein YeaQ/YmgE (transglycosylase-associated protein family)